MSIVDRQFAASLALFVAGASAFLGALLLLVAWGGWKAAAALAAAAGLLLDRFYRGARPDLPPPPRKEAS
jgi:hypothetical protein